MGVKGLQTFIEKNCPHTKERVSIPVVVDYHRATYGVRPELVIDGMAVIRTIYCSNGLDWVCGGQWIEYAQALKNFVDRFTSLDILLTFIFDGCVISAKRSEWVNRRIQKCHEIAEMFEWIQSCHRVPEREMDRFQLPTSMGSLTSMALSILCPHVQVLLTHNDADSEIALYASRNVSVFGILSNDTDFIIYNTKNYFSITDLNMNNMTTTVYKRDKLAKELSLNIYLLPLLSCLMGNDFVSKDDLRGFHRRIRQHENYQHMALPYCLADIISYNGWQGDPYNEVELCGISRAICGDPRFRDTIRQALYIYSMEEVASNSCSDLIALKHSNATICPSIYNIYRHHVYESSNVMEDIKDPHISPVALFYRPLRKRIYSILLESYGHRGTDKHEIAIHEWCAYYGNKMFEAEFVYPERLPIFDIDNTFCLEDLWTKGSEFDKLKYFVICLNINLKEKELKNIKPNFVVFCCILNYILCRYKTPCLKKWEVESFIAQAVFIQGKNVDDISAIQVDHLETRSIHLASLFMRGVATLILALGTCGYPFPVKYAMPWNCFDGKVFQKMYLEAKKALSGANLLQNNKSSMELFKELYESATFGIEFAEK